MVQRHRLITRLGVALVVVSALLGIQSGILCLFVFHEYREYHVVVAETSWPDLPAGLQTVIYCILKLVGGGFMAFGVGMACLIFPIARGDNFARCCAICLAVCVWGPALYACFVLRDANPAAEPPLGGVLVMLLLPIAGALISGPPAISASRYP